MVQLGKKQHLGTIALVLMILKYISPAIGIVLIAALLTIFDAIILQAFGDIIALMYETVPFTQVQIDNYYGLLIFGLLLIALVVFMIGVIVGWLVYRFYTFTFEEYDFRLHKGILHREEISIPYRQMQNVNIIRSLLYQVLGVSKLYIDSGAHEEAHEPDVSEIILQPIDRAIAEEIRILLQHRIGVQIVENTDATKHV